MADTTKTTNDILRRYATVFTGTAGAQAVNELGYIDKSEGVKVKPGYEEFAYSVNELAGAVIAEKNMNDFTVGIALAQVTNANLAKALGIATSLKGGGGYRTADPFSARIVANLNNDRPLHFYMPNCVSWPDAAEMALAHNKVAALMFGVKALDSSSGLVQISIGSDQQTATISSGTATFTKPSGANDIAWVKISPEGGAADDLVDFAGSSAFGSGDDGRIVRIQVDGVAAVTVKHAAGKFVMKDAADVVMDDPRDYIDFYYKHSDTSLTEIARYLAP